MQDTPTTSYFIPNYKEMTTDKRLDVRAEALWKQLVKNPGSTISTLAESRAEQVAYYRLLENPKLSEVSLTKELVSRVSPLVSGREILCVEDSCEINVSNNKNRLRSDSGLGRSDNADNATCFKIHPGLVLEAKTFCPLGFSAVKLFYRPESQPDRYERKYKSQPIEEKESYKWIEVSNASKQALKQSDSVTFIQDREGDIYEQFAIVPDAKHHLLIRSRTTRKLADDSDLYTKMDALPVSGYYTIEIPSDKRNNRLKRTAQMALRYTTVQIKRPANLKKEAYPDYIELRCVSVREITPDAEEPIDWKLLTTHQVSSVEEALKLVDWYGARWYIEQVFRLLKHKGFGIEDTLLESGWAIRKLVLMQLSALLKILQMNIAYNQPESEQPIEEVFTPEEIEVLHLMNNKLQGKTKKTQNNNNPKTTKWAAWVTGRLGGWKGYDSQGPPGVICLKKGLDRLTHIIEGIRLARDVCTG